MTKKEIFSETLLSKIFCLEIKMANEFDCHHS